MTLMDQPPHTVTVENVTSTTDRYGGQARTYGPAVSVRCIMQPIRAEESTGLGIQPDTAYQALCREWPGRIYARVTWNGRVLYQRGEPEMHRTGQLTQHDRAVLVTQAGVA